MNRLEQVTGRGPHLEEFQILSRDGNRPPVYEISRKDMLSVGENVIGTRGTRIAKFRSFGHPSSSAVI